jgi:hypothetical protein
MMISLMMGMRGGISEEVKNVRKWKNLDCSYIRKWQKL